MKYIENFIFTVASTTEINDKKVLVVIYKENIDNNLRKKTKMVTNYFIFFFPQKKLIPTKLTILSVTFFHPVYYIIAFFLSILNFTLSHHYFIV